MKKFLLGLLAVAVVISTAGMAFAADVSAVGARVGLFCDEENVVSGQPITLSLDVAATSFSGAKVVFTYPADLLDYVSNDICGDFEGTSDPSSGGHAAGHAGHIAAGGGVTREGNKITVSLANKAQMSSGATIARFAFTVKDVTESKAGIIKMSTYNAYNGTTALSCSNSNFGFMAWSGKPVIGVRYPANGATNVPVDTTFSWKAMNPSTGAGVPADVYLGEGEAVLVSTDVSCKYVPALAAEKTYKWQLVAKNGSTVTSADVWTFATAANADVKEAFNPLADAVSADEYAEAMLDAGVGSVAVVTDAVSKDVLETELGVSDVQQATSADITEIVINDGPDLTPAAQTVLDEKIAASGKVTGQEVASVGVEVPVANGANTVTVPMSLLFSAQEVFGDNLATHTLSDLFGKVAIFKYVDGTPYLLSTADKADWFELTFEEVDGIVVYSLAYTVVIYDGGTAGEPEAKSDGDYNYFLVQDGDSTDGKCVDPWKATTLTTPQTGDTASSASGGGCSVGFAPMALLLGLPLFLLRK